MSAELPVPRTAIKLTLCQRAVLQEMSCGKTDKEIALALGISPRTVSGHISNILRRLNVSTRTAAVSHNDANLRCPHIAQCQLRHLETLPEMARLPQQPTAESST